MGVLGNIFLIRQYVFFFLVCRQDRKVFFFSFFILSFGAGVGVEVHIYFCLYRRNTQDMQVLFENLFIFHYLYGGIH